MTDWLDEGEALKAEAEGTTMRIVENSAARGGTLLMSESYAPTDARFLLWLWIRRDRLLAAARLAEAEVALDNALAKRPMMLDTALLTARDNALAAYRQAVEKEASDEV